MREQLIREVEIIPLEVVVRNVAAGSLSKRLGIPEGTRLPRSIIEYYYKNDALERPDGVRGAHHRFGWASTPDLDDIVALTLAHQRLPHRPVPGRRHHAGRLQAGVRPAVGERGDAHRPGRRDQPGQLPAVGLARPTRRWTRTASAATSARSRRPTRRSRERLGILPEAGRARHEGPGADAVKATVTVMLKPGVLDPQGKAIGHALAHAGLRRCRRGARGQGDRAGAGRDRPGPRPCRRRGDGAEAAGEHGDRELLGHARLIRWKSIPSSSWPG